MQNYRVSYIRLFLENVNELGYFNDQLTMIPYSLRVRAQVVYFNMYFIHLKYILYSYHRVNVFFFKGVFIPFGQN